MARRYAILDVFTDNPLAGNPLAVVLDGDGIADEPMQKIAAEFNLSETVFVQPADNPMHSAKLRIFTPAREVPFAGHPTVGTTVLLALDALGGAGNGQNTQLVIVEENIGLVRAGVVIKSERAGFSEFDIPKLPEAVGGVLQKDIVAAALGIEPTEVGFENHTPTRYTAGNIFTFVPVRGLDVMSRIRVVPERWADAFDDDGFAAAFIYCRDTEKHDSSFHARMFAPDAGVPEDPATGSAAAAFAGVVMQFDQPTDGDHSHIIEQGFEMGRPSLIRLGLSVEGGALHTARIGGDAVVIARGELEIG